MNSKTERKRSELNPNIFDSLKGKKKKSIKFIYVFMITFFMFLLILTIFYTNYIIMSILYNNINHFYLSEYVTQPVSNINENFTQTLNMRIKTIEQIVLESKLINLAAINEFVMKNEIKSLPDYEIETSHDIIQKYDSRELNFLRDTFIGFESDSDSDFIKEKFLILSDLLNLIKNSNSTFAVDEIMILDAENMNYMTYCKNFNRQKQFIADIFVGSYLWKKTEENFQNFTFLDYIVENIYSEDSNYFNYIKIFREQIKVKGKDRVFYYFFRMNYVEIKKIFEKIGNNMTIVFQYESFIQKRMNLNFLPISDYMTLFFRYGIRYFIDPKESMAVTLLYRTVEQLENYKLTDLSIYFNILNNYDFWNKEFDKNLVRYNMNFYNEFKIISGLLYKILKTYFGLQDIREILAKENLDFQNYNNTVLFNHDECRNNLNRTYSQMMCDIIEFDQNFELQNLSIAGGNVDQSKIIPNSFNELLKNFLEINFNNPFYYQQNNIFVASKGRSFSKKFMIYLSKINNLQVVSMNMINIEKYFNVEDRFAEKIRFYSQLVTLLLVLFCLVIFIISFVITCRSANTLIMRLSWLRDIRSSIFYKEMSISSVLSESFETDYSTIAKIVKRAIDNKIEEKEKIVIVEKDKFIEMLSILIVESKIKLKKMLDKVDCGKNNFIYFHLEGDSAFTDKMKTFQRRYRLSII